MTPAVAGFQQWLPTISPSIRHTPAPALADPASHQAIISIQQFVQINLAAKTRLQLMHSLDGFNQLHQYLL